jgi:hypothetical protein
MFMYELDATQLEADPLVKEFSLVDAARVLYTNDQAGQDKCKRQQCIKRECEICETSYNDATVFGLNTYESQKVCQNLICGDAARALSTCLACDHGFSGQNFTTSYEDSATCQAQECNQCRWCAFIDAETSVADMWTDTALATSALCRAAFCSSCGGCRDNWYNQLKPGSITVYMTS